MDINKLLRENIKCLVPYATARDEFKGEAQVFLDANENPYGSPIGNGYNRYPDPLQWRLKEKISKIKGVPAKNIFLGNGSDEGIDLLFRAFCHPGKDNIIICPPTYGMYEVSANINDAEIRRIPLHPDYGLDLEGIAEAIDGQTKLIFICSPNNPTGNSMNRPDIETILSQFEGIVVVDEAYINFSSQKTFIQELTEYSNLVVLQTLSKAWGLAALRIGMAFASEEIIEVYNKVKAPYNISEASQALAMEALDQLELTNQRIKEAVEERGKLAKALTEISIVEKVYPSDANFLLCKIKYADYLYHYLSERGIIVRNRTKVILCEDCLRITVGTAQENEELIKAIKEFSFKS